MFWWGPHRFCGLFFKLATLDNACCIWLQKCEKNLNKILNSLNILTWLLTVTHPFLRLQRTKALVKCHSSAWEIPVFYTQLRSSSTGRAIHDCLTRKLLSFAILWDTIDPNSGQCSMLGYIRAADVVTTRKKNSADSYLRFAIFCCLQEDKQLHISNEEEISISACIWASTFFAMSVMLSATPLITASI